MKIYFAISMVLAVSVCSLAAEKPRVFVTDSKSWEISGGVGGSQDAFGGASKGGARPQTAEIIKTFGERCPAVIVNNKQEKADYVILLDHEGGKDMISHDNKVVVFNKDGDAIVSRSTRVLGTQLRKRVLPSPATGQSRSEHAMQQETTPPPQPSPVKNSSFMK